MSLLDLRLCLPLLALMPCVGAAQASPPASIVVRHVDRFTAEDGLAENNLDSVVQDSAGFIWILTRSGVLQRYDGHAFVDFRDLARPADSLLTREVRLVLVDLRGALWISAGRMLARLNAAYQPDRQIAVGDPVTMSAIDSAGRLWFVDGRELKVLDTCGPDSSPRRISNVAGGLYFIAAGTSGFVSLARTHSGVILVDRINPQTGDSTSFRLPDLGGPRGLTEDYLGRVWVSGSRGLAVLDRGAKQFRAIPEFAGLRTTAVTAGEPGTLFAVTEDWYARIDSSSRVVRFHTSPQAFDRSALPNTAALDDEGGVWISTMTAGLLRLQIREPVFTLFANTTSPRLPTASNFVSALREDRDGSLWIGTLRRGAYRVDLGGRNAVRFPTVWASRHLLDYEVWDFEEDLDGNRWMATSDGVCRLHDREFRCSEIAGGAWDIQKTPDGWFWLASNLNGVTSFHPRTGRVGDIIASDLEKPASAVFADVDSGHLWIGMGDRIHRARVSGGKVLGPVEHFGAPMRASDLVYQFHRDRNGRLYAGTASGLLVLRTDSSGSRFEPAPSSGLPSSPIFSIVEDTAGRLWLGSAHGLVQYAPASGVARRYGKRDNFLSGELNRRAAIVRRNGALLFGGVEGLTQFDADIVVASRRAGPVVVTRWQRMTERGLLAMPIAQSRFLQLEPRDRSFTIEFAELSYSPSPGRRYRYRLEGLNENWIETIDQSATFATPAPGRYVFRVQSASGGDESWSAPGASLVIDVAPPWWNTSWFRLALFAATALIMWMAHRWRVRQAVITERLRLRISRDLHDEIGAGLSSIALLSDATGATMPERAQLQRIGESARTMVADLRDIVWAIDPVADRGRDVAERMRDVAASLLRDVTVTYEFQMNGSGPIDMEVRRDLLRLYKEILHNVAKHSRATRAHIALQVHHGSMKLTVADNGVGFAPHGWHAGTGLKSLRERAARLGGEVTFDSSPGQGTTVRFVGRGTRTRGAGRTGVS